ncbi:MAG: hypothetical protein P9L92_19190 [Candidatus Electryonea clarkiae]|nr:hypothetical protein [Candidatus Electryonea clarkiae]MDP8287386.1 hypothetical protein [Candidatus Electryonea clarkiae]
MKRCLLILLSLSLLSTALFAQGDLERSKKKTLFVFPVQFGKNAQGVTVERQEWVQRQFYETFVSSFERFDFIAMPADASLNPFLDNAKTYMEEHARELVQKRKGKDGRIGEARVTLEDLIIAVDDGYAFVPEFDKIKKKKIKKDDGSKRIEWEIFGHIDIYRTSDKVNVGKVNGSTEGVGALLGGLRGMIDEMGVPSGVKDAEKLFRSNVNGVYDEMKTKIRKMEEFSLKAVVTSSNFNSFKFDLGSDFGVRIDRRYMVWQMNEAGKRTDMLAFGKVRKIEQSESRAQILIGNAQRGSQVVEAAKFGVNISPTIGIIPFETKGFDQLGDPLIFDFSDSEFIYDLPDDAKGYRASIGVNIEYDAGWLLSTPEVYVTVDGGWIPVGGLNVYNAMAGIQKKVYFRRLAVFGTVKYGIFGISFVDTDFFDDPNVEETDDAQVFGLGADLGGELLLTPTVALQGRIGWIGFPEQTVMTVFSFSDFEFYTPSVRAVGLTYKLTLAITI